MNNTPPQFAPLPWSLAGLWFFYFLSLPAKGVLFLLTQIFILVYVIWNLKTQLAMHRIDGKLLKWQSLWAVPLVLTGFLHLPMSVAPWSLGAEFFFFLLRVLGLTLALMWTVRQHALRINSILLIFLLTLLVHSLSMYWQWYSGWDFTYRIQVNAPDRLSGSVFNPNPFGLFMSLAIVLAGYLAFISQGLKRYTSLILIVLFSVSLYKSESRGAILGLLVALFAVILSLPYSRTWRWLLITAKFAAAGIAVWGVSLHVQRPGSDDVRWSALQRGFELSMESPWIGCGWQCTETNAILQGADGVHNVFLDIALLTGWPCALIFCSSLIWLFYVTRKKRDVLTNTLRAMLALLLAAGLFDYSALTSKMYLSALICLVTLFWLSAFRDESQINCLHKHTKGSQQ